PAEQAKTLLNEALETAAELNDPNPQTRALTTLLAIYFFRGGYGKAQIAADHMEQIAHRIGDPIHVRLAYQQLGIALCLRGRPRGGQQYLERVLRFAAAPGDRRDAIYYNSNDHAVVRSMQARALWMQGLTDQALDEARLSLQE